MRAIGIVLVILGILAFAFGGFSFTRREKVADLGPLDITKNERTPISRSSWHMTWNSSSPVW